LGLRNDVHSKTLRVLILSHLFTMSDHVETVLNPVVAHEIEQQNAPLSMLDAMRANYDQEVADKVYRSGQYVPECIRQLLEPAGVEGNNS
jgi:hypothetical protein